MTRPLNIVLELGLNADAKRGIDYYIENVVNALADLDGTNRYTLFAYFFRDYDRKRARLPLPDKPNFRKLIRRFPESIVRRVERGWKLPLIERLLLDGPPPDIYHVVGGGSLPILSMAKGITTFFDVSVEAFPPDGSQPAPGRKIWDAYNYDIAKRADCIIATGEYTRRDLKRFYDIPPEKVEIITTGVDLRIFHPIEDRARLERAAALYRLPPRFFMIIGPYVPPRRTNASFTLQAFARLKKRGLTKGVSLVLAGSPHPNLDALLEEARGLGLAEEVHATGYLPAEDLVAVYNLALAVVHPTSVEGFGFGNEVMACGTPFVTSDLPGVVEAVADAALTVPPCDADALEKALGRLLQEPGLPAELRRRGLERARNYAYPVIGRRILKLYSRLAGQV